MDDAFGGELFSSAWAISMPTVTACAPAANGAFRPDARQGFWPSQQLHDQEEINRRPAEPPNIKKGADVGGCCRGGRNGFGFAFRGAASGPGSERKGEPAKNLDGNAAVKAGCHGGTIDLSHPSGTEWGKRISYGPKPWCRGGEGHAWAVII